MSDTIYIKATSKKGENVLCPLNNVKDKNDLTDDELNECVEEDVTRRYSGNFTVRR